ncbi:MAG TPA: hypothetical protein VF262_10865 [Burkholderiales bacterium]|jgi:hypothetical protein
MDWLQIERDWSKYVVSAKERWAKLSTEQLSATRGRYGILAARVREAYGLTREQSEFQVSEWQSSQAPR